MTRNEAITLLKSPPIKAREIKNEINFVATKLGLTSNELLSFLDIPKRSYKDFKSQAIIYHLGAKIMKLLKLEVGGKR